MKLNAHDLHAMLNPLPGHLNLFDAAGVLVMQAAASNRTVAPWWYGHLGRCPPGLFKAGVPRDDMRPAFGLHFTALLDVTPTGPMTRWRRAGIGVHGGGSALAEPYDPEQPLMPTHGCWRVHNRDNALWVHHVRECQGRGGVVWVTVLPGLTEARQ